MTLKRQLGLWGVSSIAAGAMISSGLFVLPGIAFQRIGPLMKGLNRVLRYQHAVTGMRNHRAHVRAIHWCPDGLLS